MAGDDASPALKGPVYVLTTNGREFPTCGLAPRSIVRKRVAEHTSSLALSVGFVLPAMMKVHMQLDTYVVEGIDLPLGKVMEITLKSSKETLLHFVDQLARVAVQTGICCLLLRTRTAYGSSVVYLWDIYPQQHQHYVSEVVRFLRLPPFLSTLFGPSPEPRKLEVFLKPISPLAALEDSFKRNTLQLVSDVVVDVAGAIIERQCVSKGERRYVHLTAKAAMHLTLEVLKVTGAVAGQAVAGTRGAYWGEMVGIVTAPVAFAHVSLLIHSVRRRRRRTSSDGTERKRSSSGGRERKRSSSGGRERGSGRVRAHQTN